MRIVGIRIEHDDGKSKQVRRISGPEGARVVAAIALSKLLHNPINLLSFPWWCRDRFPQCLSGLETLIELQARGRVACTTGCLTLHSHSIHILCRGIS